MKYSDVIKNVFILGGADGYQVLKCWMISGKTIIKHTVTYKSEDTFFSPWDTDMDAGVYK